VKKDVRFGENRGEGKNYIGVWECTAGLLFFFSFFFFFVESICDVSHIASGCVPY